jgi:hypothetical protein
MLLFFRMGRVVIHVHIRFIYQFNLSRKGKTLLACTELDLCHELHILTTIEY